MGPAVAGRIVRPRATLIYRVLRRGNLHGQLEQIFARHDGEAGIIYCPSRRELEAWRRG